jgi:aspartyl-tRNA(Asn)/glutamyl-tRNA(Gln) amidotransferase subunit B
MEFIPTIGLEVHTQLNTNSKAWCSCEVNAHALENTKVCEVCSAQPGTLPVLNKKVVEYTAKLSMATNAKLNLDSNFERKNYFYPDLPKGYQITQLDTTFAESGYLTIEDDDGKMKKIGIERIQIEEDTGKSSHEGEYSLINLNRCGTPLIEIVGMPEISTATEASRYLKELHSILTYLGVSKGNLQEGNFRCDVNVSVRKAGETKLGTRTETKNLNSFRNVEKVIELEINRQTEVIKNGGAVDQVTMTFDPLKMILTPMRSKSDAHDYRYFPEPDLLPLVVSAQEVEEWKNELPELPREKRSRFVSDYDIPVYDAGVITSNIHLAHYFEEVVQNTKATPKKASNWLMGEFLRLLNEYSIEVTASPIPPKDMANLLNFVESGRISGKMAKEVFEKMFDGKQTADDVIKELGIEQISDETFLEDLAQKILQDNVDNVEKYLSGRDKVFGFFVGQMMKLSKGQANPQLANKILKEQIEIYKKNKN